MKGMNVGQPVDQTRETAAARIDRPVSELYGELIAEILRRSDPARYAVTTPENVFQPAVPTNRPHFERIMNDLMLPGSGVAGVENLLALGDLADHGRSVLVLSAHFSNFDVPALYTLLKRAGEQELFERIVFIAGRKLTEGCASVKALAEMFSRVVISAKTPGMGEQQASAARAINKAAQRAIAAMQRQGRIFLLYPTGTRSRPWAPQTFRGLREVYNYLRNFEYCCVCGIRGNILPPRDDVDLIDEFPRHDTVVYRFGPVREIAAWVGVLERHLPEASADRKQFVVDAIMEEAYALGDDPRGEPAGAARSPVAPQNR